MGYTLLKDPEAKSDGSKHYIGKGDISGSVKGLTKKAMEKNKEEVVKTFNNGIDEISKSCSDSIKEMCRDALEIIKLVKSKEKSINENYKKALPKECDIGFPIELVPIDNIYGAGMRDTTGKVYDVKASRVLEGLDDNTHVNITSCCACRLGEQVKVAKDARRAAKEAFREYFTKIKKHDSNSNKKLTEQAKLCAKGAEKKVSGAKVEFNRIKQLTKKAIDNYK